MITLMIDRVSKRVSEVLFICLFACLLDLVSDRVLRYLIITTTTLFIKTIPSQENNNKMLIFNREIIDS